MQIADLCADENGLIDYEHFATQMRKRDHDMTTSS